MASSSPPILCMASANWPGGTSKGAATISCRAKLASSICSQLPKPWTHGQTPVPKRLTAAQPAASTTPAHDRQNQSSCHTSGCAKKRLLIPASGTLIALHLGKRRRLVNQRLIMRKKLTLFSKDSISRATAAASLDALVCCRWIRCPFKIVERSL